LHLEASLAPQGTLMTSVRPVWVSVRRIANGRTHTPACSAMRRSTSLAIGMDIRSALDPGLGVLGSAG
jgi:hypothetical protein